MKLSELWLQFAYDDLKSTKVLLAEGVYNISCFHAQQAVEKLFKALIATYDQPIPRTHNLIRLHKICEDLFGDKLEIDNEKIMLLMKSEGYKVEVKNLSRLELCQES